MPSKSDLPYFREAVLAAFLRVMRARRPELLWSAREAVEVGEGLAEPEEPGALANGEPRAS